MVVLFWNYRFSLIREKLLHQSKMIVFGSPVLRMSQSSLDIGGSWSQIRRYRPIQRRWSSNGRLTTLFFQSLLSFQGNLKYTVESFFMQDSSYLTHIEDLKTCNLSCHNTLSSFDQFATWTNAVLVWACPLVTLIWFKWILYSSHTIWLILYFFFINTASSFINVSNNAKQTFESYS